MKIPKTDFEQKCWIVMAVLMASVAISAPFGVEIYGKYLALSGLIVLATLCIISKKKNWISEKLNYE